MLFSCLSTLLRLGDPWMADGLRYTMTIIMIATFLFVHLACKLSIVIASTEESSNGFSAIKTVEIIRGRRGQFFVLMTLMLAVEKIVSVAARIALKLLWCSVCCRTVVNS